MQHLVLSHILCNDICNDKQALYYMSNCWEKKCRVKIRTDKEDKNKASYDCENCETNTTDNAIFNVEFIWIYCVFHGRILRISAMTISNLVLNTFSVNLPTEPLSVLSSK